MTSEIDVDTTINEKNVSGYQLRIVALCVAAMTLDGFNAQIISLIASPMARDLRLPLHSLGAVFSTGLFGLMLGSLMIGPLADKYGRRWMIILSIVLSGAFTFATATASTMDQLLAFRFLTGLGLGGAMPNLAALATEYVPARLERVTIGWVFMGFALGQILAGVVAGFVLPAAGWRVVLAVGAALALLISVILVVWLPESVRFLMVAKAASARIARIMRRVDPTGSYPVDSRFRSNNPKAVGLPIGSLFTHGRAPHTLLFWVAFFGNLLVIFFVLSWFPALLQNSGLSMSVAIVATTLFSCGGAVGALSVGYLMNTLGVSVTIVGQLALSAALIVVIGSTRSAYELVWIASLLLGFGAQGAQTALNAVVANYYPTSIRSTGLGWALGIGRLGSIVGPILAGWMLTMHWSVSRIFLFATAPALMAALAVAVQQYAGSRVEAAQHV
jgi:AAHS family 4-hydroxybenzoate transporter-like MFS transporter